MGISVTSYKNWPVLLKIMVIPLISLVLIIAGTELIIMPRFESWLLEQEKLKVRNVVEIAFQQIEGEGKEAAAGKLSADDAKKEVIAHIKKLRYGGTEYFWINDLTPNMVMHPTKPELDGTSLADFKDPKGKRLFMEFVKVCSENGEGFVSYMWPKPGESKPVPKISYVKLYKPWGWIVGSGLYVDTFEKRLRALHNFAMTASLVGSFTLIVLAWSIGRGIKRSVDHGRVFASEVASGNLMSTLPVTRSDEIGQLGGSLNQMASDLRRMISRVTATASELASTSSDIARASRIMVRSAEQQNRDVTETSEAAREIHNLVEEVSKEVDSHNNVASRSATAVMELSASVEEVSLNMAKLARSVDGISDSIGKMAEKTATIDANVQSLTEASGSTATSVLEFDSSIRRINEYVHQSAAITEEVRADAETGKNAVKETIAGIDGIMHASRISAEAISSLSGKAKNIDSIVNVIDEIAEQTNLLALNASIIAAQSGEHGRSFAVVASEIKLLAARTSTSTKEIANTLKAVQGDTMRAVHAINDVEKSIKDGEMLSVKAGEALGKIVLGVEQTANQTAEIARATQEMSRGSDMIRAAMDEVAAMSHTIAETTHSQREESEAVRDEIVRVRDFSSLVEYSMHEQSKVSEEISRMSEELSESSNRIQLACAEQIKGNQRIQKAVESIQNSASAVLNETRTVDSSVTKLSDSAGSLRKDMACFKL